MEIIAVARSFGRDDDRNDGFRLDVRLSKTKTRVVSGRFLLKSNY